MRVLVATSKGQRADAGDYSWTIEGELVTFGISCSCFTCRYNPDISMTGVTSNKASTTFTVADLDLSVADYIEVVAGSYVWAYNQFELDDDHGLTEALELLEIAGRFAIGAVLERFEDLTCERTVAV